MNLSALMVEGSPLKAAQMGKGEISWTRRTEDGGKLDVNARLFGGQWSFYTQQRRFDQWQLQENPPLDDWLELLDGVRRRVQRRLMRPEEVQRVEQLIRERFPEAEV